MKTPKFPLFLILIFNHAFAQTFERVYGTNYESAPHLISAIDGGFIMAGSTMFAGAPNGSASDILIVKTDSMGFMQWSETIKSVLDDEAIWIEAETDSTYLVCGNSYDNNNGKLDVFVIRLNTVGTILSQQLYRSYDAERAACMQKTKDHGSIIAGETLINGADLQMYLLKLDSAGNIDWSMSYGDGDQEYGTYVMQTPDNGYITSGVARINSFVSSICVVKTDSSGNLQWAQKYNTAPVQSKCLVFRILPANDDNGYIICGSSTNNQSVESMLLMKIDSAGNIVWQKVYRSLDTEFTFDALNDDIGYTICGPANNQLGTEKMIMLNVNDAGHLMWQLGYGIADSTFTPTTIMKYSNGRYMISGITDATTFGLPRFLLIQSDSTFDQSLCNMFLPTLIENSAQLLAASFNSFTVDTSFAIPANYTVSNGVGEDLICTGSVSVPENDPSSDFNIYKNSQGNILVDVKNDKGPAVIHIYDLQGQLLQTVKLEMNSGRKIIVTNLSEGLYIFKVDAGMNTFTKKVMIYN